MDFQLIKYGSMQVTQELMLNSWLLCKDHKVLLVLTVLWEQLVHRVQLD
jgi:hypothetical protein